MADPPSPRERPRDGAEGTCLECGATVTGRFCADCGAEKRAPLRPFQQWLSDTVGQVVGLDLKLFRTLPRLFFSPGWLTVEYSAGRRGPYTSPLRLYVAASAVVIAAMNLIGTFQLDEMLAGVSEEQRDALAAMLGFADLSDPDLQQRFNRRMDLIFPILNLFSPIGMTLLLKLLYPGRYLQEHLAFGCHYGTFIVFVWLPPLLVEGVALVVVTTAVTFVSLLYLGVAMRRVYGGGWGGVIARLVAFSVGVLVMLVAMQTLTLLITLGTI